MKAIEAGFALGLACFGIVANFRSGESIERGVVGRMDSDELALQVRRELLDGEAVLFRGAGDFVAVAFALAGTVNIDMNKDPIGKDKQGKEVFLKDLWPSSKEIYDTIAKGLKPEMFKKRYAHILDDNPVWAKIPPKKMGWRGNMGSEMP